MDELKIGDIVTLKSGGPLMTVTVIYVDDEDGVGTSWFEARGEPPHSARFPTAALKRHKQEANVP